MLTTTDIQTRGMRIAGLSLKQTPRPGAKPAPAPLSEIKARMAGRHDAIFGYTNGLCRFFNG
jgi:hypothetical protein